MLKEWSVRIEAAHNAGAEHSLKVVDHLMRQLREYAVVGSGGPTSLDVQMSVTADSLESAFARCIKTFTGTVRKSGMLKQFQIVGVELETVEHFESRLNEADPELVGIAELAALLGVSRARASAIAARRDFPAPYSRLASGPVWMKANLSRWLEEWRPRASMRRNAVRSDSAAAGAESNLGLAAKPSD